MLLTSHPFASSSDLWLWPGADSRPRARPHRLLDRVRGHALVQGSRNHAQLKGRRVRRWCGFCVGPDGFFVLLTVCVTCVCICLCLRATPSPLTSGQWAASWLRCCPTSPSSLGNTTWTSSTTYWVRQSFTHQSFSFVRPSFTPSLCSPSYPLNYDQIKHKTFTVSCDCAENEASNMHVCRIFPTLASRQSSSHVERRPLSLSLSSLCRRPRLSISRRSELHYQHEGEELPAVPACKTQGPLGQDLL